MEYKPSTLDSDRVSFIEVVSLSLQTNKQNNQKLSSIIEFKNPIINALEKGNPSFIANGKDSQKIANLFRQLSYDIQFRCHIPPYGFKFHFSDATTMCVSVCWECNNGHVWLSDASNQRGWFSFDASSKPAQDLLEICRINLSYS